MHTGMLLLSLTALAVAGCSIGPAREQVAHYDLGPPPAIESTQARVNLRAVEVESPSWLDGQGLQYRLAYANKLQRESYAESRWVAPPGQLLEQALRRAVISGDSVAGSGGCKLRVELDEFLHVFDQPATSFGLIEARAALLAPRNDALLARRSFSLRRPAPTQDARGGVAALSGAVEQLTREVSDWLAALEREAGQGFNIARTCRAGIDK